MRHRDGQRGNRTDTDTDRRNSTQLDVELSCVAINGPYAQQLVGLKCDQNASVRGASCSACWTDIAGRCRHKHSYVIINY